MQDLNDMLPAGSGWELEIARAINASGRIVGTGRYKGQQRAFLMTPPRPFRISVPVRRR